jgi:hypothetical protein
LDLSRPDAPRTNAEVRAGAVHDGVDTLKVRPLNRFGLAIRVADLVLDDALLAADFTLRGHGISEGAYV